MTVKDRSCFICLQATMYCMLLSSKVSRQHSWRAGLPFPGCRTQGLDEAAGLRVGWVLSAELGGMGRGRTQRTPVCMCACLWAQVHVLPEQNLRDCRETGSRHATGLREDEKQRPFSCRLCSIVAETHAKLLGWEQDREKGWCTERDRVSLQTLLISVWVSLNEKENHSVSF